MLKNPNSGTAWGELGMTFRVHGFYPQSNACFARAAHLDPENPRWPYLIGLINLLFTPDDAVPHLRTAARLAKAISAHWTMVIHRLGRGGSSSGGDMPEAEACCSARCSGTPPDEPRQRSTSVWAAARRRCKDSVKAYAHFQTGRRDQAVRAAGAAAFPAAAARRGKRPRASRRAMSRPGRGRPDDLPWPDPFVTEYGEREAGRSEKWRRVTELQEDGRRSEALAVLEELARTAPDTRTLLAIGRVLEEIGDYERAVPMFRAVLAENPNHAAARFYLGFVLYKQGADRWERGDRTEPTRALFEAAVAELHRSTERAPDHGQRLHTWRGNGCCGDQRLLPEAEAACREAVLYQP